MPPPTQNQAQYPLLPTRHSFIARRYWQAAGVTHKIDLHIAPAMGTLNHLFE